jgi:hypothetical protein
LKHVFVLYLGLLRIACRCFPTMPHKVKSDSLLISVGWKADGISFHLILLHIYKYITMYKGLIALT